MANENRFLQYSRYAIGEIVLVMVGILLALQVNNWNELRKENLTIVKLYQNLESSLKTDSIALSTILVRSNNSMSSMTVLLNATAEELFEKFSYEEIRKLARNVFEGVYSFYPKMGIYNQIVSSNQMELIKSEQIKEALRMYYDFRCTRYRSLDPIMDTKFHIAYQAFMADRLHIVYNDNFDLVNQNNTFSKKDIEDLQNEIRKLYDLTEGVDGILIELSADVKLILNLIRKQLD